MVSAAALFVGCDDDSDDLPSPAGSSGSGGGGAGGAGGAGGQGGQGGQGGGGGGGGGQAGSGGQGGAGGAGGAPNACPTQAINVSATLIDPQGVRVGFEAVDVSGAIVATGVGAPPSALCAPSQAWATIKDGEGNDQWIACLQAPGLQLGLAPGDQVTLTQEANTHGVAGASLHVTLRKAGALVAHVERSIVETDVALPEGLSLARGAVELCSSPDAPCQPKGYGATASGPGGAVPIAPGEAATVGGFRVYLDRYWLESPSSACESGGADILLAVTPGGGR